ncbi:TPA: hypothetical protein RPD96_004933 [Escherichia coli]|nr:hypothetical protein [Escherichia coli]
MMPFHHALISLLLALNYLSQLKMEILGYPRIRFAVSNAELMAIAAVARDGERWQRLALCVHATAWHDE